MPLTKTPNPLSFPNLLALFDSVSARYDLLNRILSLGRDLFWREALARRIQILDFPGNFLDLATGSGDQLLAIRKFWPHSNLTGLDFSNSMLDVARRKISHTLPEDENIGLILGNALDPPFPVNSFDSISISFGLRNIPDRQALYPKVLSLLKPGGRFLVLELYFDSRSIFAPIELFHLEKITPWIAQKLVYKQGKAYDYLSRSILNFPHPSLIQDELIAAGFKGVQYQTYTFHTTMLVWGQKPIKTSY
ncbi:MAG: ubiquinone/menaquinone biosynthesis methyltransferase [Deltaproteobacteria bacterium]|jgi:demethylmenaquinone methyltransferase/2-methoxy-6-polyprenyl-1,4-benzoquinol methylase|nr:ubiquinone/menaquinone biosynthesis methyltransferase [Deltaproteobacteria bacterium]